MPTGLERIRAMRDADRRALRKKILIMIIAVLALWLVMSCMRSTAIGFVSPIQAVKNIFTAFRLEIARLFHWDLYNHRASIIADHAYYYETLGNCRATLIALLMGAVLSMAGGIFQNVFRNPIATPSMLGVSSGVNMGNLVLVLVFGTSAVQMIKWRFLLGFAIAGAMLICIFALSRLTGGRKASVTDMLLIGAVFMRTVQNVIMIYETYLMSDDEYLLLEELNTYGTNIYQDNTVLWVFAILVVCALIVISMRFSINALSFTDEEAKMLGINAPRVRLIVLLCSTLMTTAVQINYGDIGMLALLIPHLCRNWFGADFRLVLLGSAGFGAILLMLCRLVRFLFGFNQYLSLVSMGTIINMITLPIIIIILIRQRRGWVVE